MDQRAEYAYHAEGNQGYGHYGGGIRRVDLSTGALSPLFSIILGNNIIILFLYVFGTNIVWSGALL